ncbi:MAG TPA: hypothetical protein VMW43_10395 [Bacteroidota bacterium]|nr:hypothetical protein [Bacteroidota bacterium]
MLTTRTIKWLFLRTLMPAVLCMTAGFCFFGLSIFTVSHAAFQFVSNGIIGAVFLCLLRCTNVKNAVGIYIVLAVLDSAFVSEGISTGFIMRDFFFALSLALSLLIFYYLSIANQPQIRWIDILFLGGLLATSNVIATTLLVYMYHTTGYITAAALNGFIGLFSGIGLGFGTLMTQFFHLNPEEEPA